jgi:hypothetical protein
MSSFARAIGNFHWVALLQLLALVFLEGVLCRVCSMLGIYALGVEDNFFIEPHLH